jgi:hypothetical protein
MKISEVLWEASELLATHDFSNKGHSRYICDCIEEAVYPDASLACIARDFLYSLGMDSGLEVFEQFYNKGDHTEDSQAVRYAWLTLAATYAEELGK